MKHLIVFCLIGVSSLAGGQEKLEATTPGEAGIMEERIMWLDTLIQSYVDKDQLNGSVALIARNSKIGYFKAFGYSNLEEGKPMQKDNIFRLASMTKPVVSVALMMLYEEGKFMLDDPVSRYIPAFKNPVVLDTFNPDDSSYTTVPAKREITIRHLLSHTSGIAYPQIGSSQANAIYAKHHITAGLGDPYSSISTVIQNLAGLPLFNQPGEAFLYGLNVDVIGYLVEVLSGIPLDAFLNQRLLIPLGMKDTYFYLPPEKQSRLVPMYKLADGTLTIQDSLVNLNGRFLTQYPKLEGTHFSGGGGLSSTAYDYAIFCQMLLNEGSYNGKRYLSPTVVRMMTSNQIGDLVMFGQTHNPRRFGLGFGIYTQYAERTMAVSESSFEWGGMFATHFWIDPREKLFVIFMRNIWPTPHWGLGDRVKPVVYQALE